MKKRWIALLSSLLLIALCSCALAARTFEINPKLNGYNGATTIKWTDTGRKSPYVVGFRYDGPGDATQSLRPLATDVSGTSIRTTGLIPGKRYYLIVYDRDQQLTYSRLTIPGTSAPFKDDKLTPASIQVLLTPSRYPVEGSSETAELLNTLKAEEIIANLDSYNYGLHYQLDFPPLRKTRQYQTLLAFYAPNGYVYSYDIGMQAYARMEEGDPSFYWSCIGTEFFRAMYQENGVIPTGSYTTELYWNGKLANTTTFNVE